MCCSVLQRVAVCCSVLQCVAVCCSVLQCVAMCCSVLHHHQTHLCARAMSHTRIVSLVTKTSLMLQHTATHCNTLPHTATHCNTLQHRWYRNTCHNSARGDKRHHTKPCEPEVTASVPEVTASGAERYSTLQHTAAHCNTLQHTATHCNTLPHTATHCNTRCNSIRRLTLQHSYYRVP